MKLYKNEKGQIVLKIHGQDDIIIKENILENPVSYSSQFEAIIGCIEDVCKNEIIDTNESEIVIEYFSKSKEINKLMKNQKDIEERFHVKAIERKEKLYEIFNEKSFKYKFERLDITNIILPEEVDSEDRDDDSKKVSKIIKKFSVYRCFIGLDDLFLRID